MTNRAIGPQPVVPERARQVYETVQAAPRDQRDRVRRAHEELRAEEGLGWSPEYSGSFVGGAAVEHGIYEVKEAGQAAGRSRLGSGQMIPAWTDEPAYRSAFAAGATGDQNAPAGLPWAARRGGNPHTITPLSAISAGERPGSIVVKTIATPGRGVRNIATLDEAQ
jgi:hypothetical protein